jgi:hypothetical protein
MICVEKNCGGEVSKNKDNRILASEVVDFFAARGSTFKVAYPCNKCNRLHLENGEGVKDRTGKRAFMQGIAVIYKE